MREYESSSPRGLPRPGSIADANDEAQFAELKTPGELTRIAWSTASSHERGARARPHAHSKRTWRSSSNGATRRPLHLGPLTTEIAPGTITSRQRSARAQIGWYGTAMLATSRKEHLGLPNRDDVKAGVIAYKIAAHAADLAKGHPAHRRGTTPCRRPVRVPLGGQFNLAWTR